MPPKKVTQHTSTRKRQTVDYSKLDNGLGIPSPPCKRHKPNLLRKPSKIVMAAHKKRKQLSPLGTTKGTTETVTTTMTQTPLSSSASTSTSHQIGTVMVSASADETKTAIAALLSLGSDLPQPDEDDTAENAQLVPINPIKMDTTDDPVPSSSV